MSISRLVIVGGILAALLPVALLALGYTLRTRALLLNSTLEQNQLLAREAAHFIDRVLIDHRNFLAFVGQQLGEDGLNAERVLPALAKLRTDFPLFDRILVATPDGAVVLADPAVADNGQRIAGINVADRAYFQTVMRSGKPYLDPDVLIGRSSGAPVMIIAAPIPGANAGTAGVLIGTLDLEGLTQLIGRLRVGASGRAVAVSRDGTTVSHPDLRRVQQRFNFSTSPIWQHIAGAADGRIEDYRDETNGRRFAAFATVPSSGWKIWLSQEHAEVDSEFLALLAASSFWPLAAIAAGILMIAFLARVIARPIRGVYSTAERIAAGELDQRAPEEGPAEVATLAAAINSMAAALKSRIEAETQARASIEKTVNAYGSFAEQVARGDFSAKVVVDNAGDLERLGHGLNAMSQSLGLLVGEIKGATAQLGSASAEILAATTQQAAATAEEAAAVRQMAASVHELRQAGESVARRTQNVLDTAQKTETIAETGLQSVAETVRSAEEGRQRLATLAEKVMGFSERTQEIAEINATVGEIAEKSNLLAVNASIEAAKAGEAGRGFAVVASEVKELAEQSKAATAQVRRIIADIQRSAQSAVIAAEQYAKSSDAAVLTSRQSGTAISSLAGRITEAAQAARQNLAAAEQQQAGIEQIALAVDNIETSSAQTVAATSQVEQSARSLHDLAVALETMVRRVSVSHGEERAAAG
ncbi:methyl-accepting chemotaxis protein [Xanthobacter sp. KR7-65]|uniref:methyl-accepting chemotaxis protein n=1 Tax=Xanthobacter sp. KR7-65 TaxID=3156612 RepID=UPI0032B5EF17